MHGCSSGFVLVVNAELDYMGGVGISLTPSLHQSSDLEKTQAELRQTFTAAEKFRRELEFLQKGGDPLDLKPGNAASVSFQSTSPTDRHPEQFVTSEAKGSFAINASPHRDSVESSDRLGAPSVCEPNSADNLMLLKESGDSAVLELPKKSYKRRIRSRPNRDGARSSSTDVVPSRGGHFLPFRHASNSNPKSPNASVAQNSTSHLESELDGTQAVQSTLGPAHGPYSAVLEANDLQNAQENHHDLPVKSDGREVSLTPTSIQPESVGHIEQAHLTESKCPTNGFRNTEELKSIPEPTKVLDAESSCTQTSQRFDDCNGNGLCTTVPMEQNLEGNDLGAEKNDKILNDKILNVDKTNEDGSAIKDEEGLKGSESTKGVGSDSCTDLKAERKPSVVVGSASISQDNPPFQEDTLSVRHSTDGAEQNACSQDNLKLATKEYEDSVLEEARIIEAKRTRIAELTVRTLPLERRIKSQWDFVLEEMSWLANDFAQEHLWKLTAAAQISRRVVFASRARFQQQRSLQKQKEVSHTLAETVMQFWHMIQVKCKGPDSHCLEKDHAVGIQGYAMRFMEYNSSQAQCTTQPPAIPDCISELDIMDHSWEDNLTEENLFYTVPPGAIEAYRKAIDSHLLNFERTGSSVQEEVDTSCYDAVADNTFEEDEGETSTYYLPGVFEGRKSPKSAQKGRKNFKLYGPRSYEMGGDLTFGTQPSVLSGKRSGSSLNVTIPTKRVRTASRQRVISPFNAGTSGHLMAPNRTDASSGDNNSFQDEQSTLHGGPPIPNNMEAESVGDYEKQLQFDSMEVSNRPKKKKKAKHSGSTFEHRWQLDSNFQNDHKDHSRRRQDAHQFDSNGSSAASQMSNMSNPNKFMKLLVRDRSRKVKALKTPVGPPGSGSPWSLFEDQALVVLVHDMGPNWELISDAINSILQFKCIFRKSKECKERHKNLMDRNGDGADSAEDSGSSQPYPSTLPGIPEGSARQLFQRLQGPMEEDTLKTHFEKIIMIGQKQHYRTQNDNQDPKQLQQPHSSHAFALSQVCPNNLNGGPVLTPLELCEAISSSPDVVPVGYQGPHSSGLPVLNHGSGSISSAPGSSNSLRGSNIPSTSGPLNPSVREGRYGIPRTGSLSADDQQRIQQYNQMLSARNAQQSSLPPGSHSVTDRGVQMLPAGNGMGVMSGINRNMKMARPSMLSPGTATSSSMLRPRDPMHMIRPNQNTDQQVSQSGPTQGIPTFASGTSSSLPNQISQEPPISPQQYPHHFQGPPNHANPAYAMRLAKERQLQQQRLMQQQQQFATSNPMMPHVQSQESQLPVSLSAQNSKHPVTPPHGFVNNNPQTSGNQIMKQPRQRPSQQFQQLQQRQQASPQQPAKLMKGGRGNMTIHQNLPTDSSPVNVSGGQSTLDKGLQSGHGNLYPGSSAGKQSVHHSSLNQPHQNHVSSTLQKLANQKQKQATTPQKLLLNRKPNTSDQPTSTSQPSTNVSMPNSIKTDTPAVSLAAPPDSTETSGAETETETESSGPAINQAVVNKQSSSNSLPNPVGNDAGVQWQPPS